MNDSDRASIDRVAEALTLAWNTSDGAAFARSFADDADFVNIYGMHVAGAAAIAKQHQAIFDGIYRDSRIVFSVVEAREIAGGAIVARVDARLQVPRGPMAPGMHTLATAVLLREASEWRIVAFHNTREQAPPVFA